MTIREAWDKWESIDVPAYHKNSCEYLYGSRPEEVDCNCGLRQLQKAKDAAFVVLRDLVKRLKSPRKV